MMPFETFVGAGGFRLLPVFMIPSMFMQSSAQFDTRTAVQIANETQCRCTMLPNQPQYMSAVPAPQV